MKIYVASSWRNEHQPGVLQFIRKLGHEVYDFKHPAPGNNGFHWSELDGGWKNWTFYTYRAALNHPITEDGFTRDMEALRRCDVCVLVQPCGRSAHLELGYAAGARKRTAIYYPPGVTLEPELMAKMVDQLLGSEKELAQWLASIETWVRRKNSERIV